jgi:hypothetical protein
MIAMKLLHAESFEVTSFAQSKFLGGKIGEKLNPIREIVDLGIISQIQKY